MQKHSFPSCSPSNALRHVGSGCRVPESGIGLKGNMPHPSRYRNLAGLKFGHLTPVKFVGKNKFRMALWECLCDCGKVFTIHCGDLTSGNTSSCGCHSKDHCTTHGMTKTKTYAAWSSMIDRCSNPNNKHWKDYGGRGIRVCERWQKFEFFLEDMKECPTGLSLDKIDNNKDYEPGNCRWISMKDQQSNKRTNVMITLHGKTQHMAQWSRDLGISKTTIRLRIKAGLSPEQILCPSKIEFIP